MASADYREITPQDSLTVSGSVEVSSVTGTVTTGRTYYTDFGTITPGAGALSPLPKALFFSGAGDVTMEDDAATAVTLTVVASQFVEGVQPTKITAWTGTAGQVTWFA